MSPHAINPQAASAFVATMLHGVTMAHMHHLTVNGPSAYAKHMALGELYAGLQDKADELAEALMGCTKVVFNFQGSAFAITENLMADVQRLYEFAEKNRAAVGYETHIQNIVDEICSVIATALFKLRRLQ